jgi:hypothetical protein
VQAFAIVEVANCGRLLNRKMAKPKSCMVSEVVTLSCVAMFLSAKKTGIADWCVATSAEFG